MFLYLSSELEGKFHLNLFVGVCWLISVAGSAGISNLTVPAFLDRDRRPGVGQ